MSDSASPRPLSSVPFYIADGVLLLTALLIAWGTPETLSGGALFAVVVCVALGALLLTVPFVLNELRRREAATEKRQRELLDLVTSTTATASHWGAQWAAAATGLEDAASLAARNLAAAENLPHAVQAKIDALSARFESFEQAARAREERAAKLEEAARVRTDEANAAATKLSETLVQFERVNATLREQHEALSRALTALPDGAKAVETTRVALAELIESAPRQVSASIATAVETATNAATAAVETRVAANIERATATAEQRIAAVVEQATTEGETKVAACFDRVTGDAERRLSGQADATARRIDEIAAKLGAAEQRVASAVEQAMASGETKAAACFERATGDAERRLSDQAAVFAQRFDEMAAKLETAVATASERVEQTIGTLAAIQPVASVAQVVSEAETKPETAPEIVGEAVATNTPASVEPAAAEPAPTESEPVAETQPEPEAVVTEEPVVNVVVTSDAPAAKPVQAISKESIMDPFYIPEDGYSALAEAMDSSSLS